MKTVVKTDAAPKAIGPYSQAIKTKDVIFFSGQIPLNPETMELISTNFNEQAEQVFKNIQSVCKAANGSMNDIVKLTIYLTDLKDFAALNDIMKNYFAEPYPARSTIQVSALPKAALIEIEAIMAI